MGQPITLTGAQIICFINNAPYKVTQSVSYTIDYSEEEIHGIDVPWAQEIAGGKVMIRGSIKGLRIKLSGGLQGSNIRPLFTDLGASPYISIRIQDRSTGEDIILIPKAKASNESHSITIKSSYKLNFDFVGQMALFALDRAD